MCVWVSEYIWAWEWRWEATVLTSYKLKAPGVYSLSCTQRILVFLICRITMIWETPANQQPWCQRYSQLPRCLSAFQVLMSSQKTPLEARFVWGRSLLSGKEGHKLEWQLCAKRLGCQLEGMGKGLPIPLYLVQPQLSVNHTWGMHMLVCVLPAEGQKLRPWPCVNH